MRNDERRQKLVDLFDKAVDTLEQALDSDEPHERLAGMKVAFSYFAKVDSAELLSPAAPPERRAPDITPEEARRQLARIRGGAAS